VIPFDRRGKGRAIIGALTISPKEHDVARTDIESMSTGRGTKGSGSAGGMSGAKGAAAGGAKTDKKGSGGSAKSKINPVKVYGTIAFFLVTSLFLAYRLGLFDRPEEDTVAPGEADSSTLTPEEREQYRKAQEEQERLRERNAEDPNYVPPSGS
jgi:hypothetical protein